MGIFDNATSITINNKDVSSITIGTAIVWQKPSPQTKIATHITKSGNYLYLYDVNNNALKQKQVKAYRNGSLYTTYTTNNSGRFTYSSRNTYVYDGDDTYDGCTYP